MGSVHLSSLSEILRNNTSTKHIELEKTTGLPDSINTKADLSLVLEVFYGFYKSIDFHLIRMPLWDQLGLPQCQIEKSSMLRNDLIHLGYSESNLGDIPLCSHVPQISCFWSAIGAAYVIEGATMGGQILSRHCKSNNQLHDIPAMSFFDSYGKSTGSKWRQFKRVIDALKPEEAERDIAIDASVQTFTSLNTWYQTRHASSKLPI